MNNEPVAWMYKDKENGMVSFFKETLPFDAIPLYTHPVKEQKCVVKDCENHRNENGFTGDLCNPCYQFIANGEGVYSQAYRNVHPVKELTDEEIKAVYGEYFDVENCDWLHLQCIQAILRKAQE